MLQTGTITLSKEKSESFKFTETNIMVFFKAYINSNFNFISRVIFFKKKINGIESLITAATVLCQGIIFTTIYEKGIINNSGLSIITPGNQ